MWIEIHLSLWLNIILHIHRVKLLMVDREKFAEITINLKQSAEITQSQESFQYPIARVEKTPWIHKIFCRLQKDNVLIIELNWI